MRSIIGKGFTLVLTYFFINFWHDSLFSILLTIRPPHIAMYFSPSHINIEDEDANSIQVKHNESYITQVTLYTFHNYLVTMVL